MAPAESWSFLTAAMQLMYGSPDPDFACYTSSCDSTLNAARAR